jgi:hypothetical protein
MAVFLAKTHLRQERLTIQLQKDITMESQMLETTKAVFDLDSKSDVTLYKAVEFTPAQNNNVFLKIVNDGLRAYTLAQARDNDAIAWQAKDDEGNLIPYSGTSISEEKSKQLAANVLTMAKLAFGYSKELSADEKRVSKDKAQKMLLDNPAVVEGLRKG